MANKYNVGADDDLDYDIWILIFNAIEQNQWTNATAILGVIVTPTNL